MKEVFQQPASVWRYVALKRAGDTLPALAVVATALWGLWAGVGVLALQIVVGGITDLAFFSALKTGEE